MIRHPLRLLSSGLFAAVTLAACSDDPAYREWRADKETAGIAAYDECDEEVDVLMRLRGYPNRPLPETPQFEYRKTMFAQCMRKKGYAAE